MITLEGTCMLAGPCPSSRAAAQGVALLAMIKLPELSVRQ